jgi:hypothetical protein
MSTSLPVFGQIDTSASVADRAHQTLTKANTILYELFDKPGKKPTGQKFQAALVENIKASLEANAALARAVLQENKNNFQTRILREIERLREDQAEAIKAQRLLSQLESHPQAITSLKSLNHYHNSTTTGHGISLQVQDEKDRVTIRVHIASELHRKNIDAYFKQPRALLKYIHETLGSKGIKTRVIGAGQLKSGDLELVTLRPEDRLQLVGNAREWLPLLGPGARILENMFGVIVHGISVKSVNMETTGKKSVIEAILKENTPPLHLDANILFIGWLNKSTLPGKKVPSIVIQFGHPEDANTVLDRGLIWEGAPRMCEFYDPHLRLLTVLQLLPNRTHKNPV